MKPLIFLFITISIIFSSCSKQSAEEYMNLANDSIQKGNFEEAHKYLEKIIDYYPQSELSVSALLQIAEFYLNGKLNKKTEDESYRSAIEYYVKLQNEFPKHSKAPMALFMAGFVASEKLKDYGLAEKYYKKFLEIYPEHEMAVSAKEEINNLGKTPEEILSSKNFKSNQNGPR